jgi:hypothetical protein
MWITHNWLWVERARKTSTVGSGQRKRRRAKLSTVDKIVLAGKSDHRPACSCRLELSTSLVIHSVCEHLNLIGTSDTATRLTRSDFIHKACYPQVFLSLPA